MNETLLMLILCVIKLGLIINYYLALRPRDDLFMVPDQISCNTFPLPPPPPPREPSFSTTAWRGGLVMAWCRQADIYHKHGIVFMMLLTIKFSMFFSFCTRLSECKPD